MVISLDAEQLLIDYIADEQYRQAYQQYKVVQTLERDGQAIDGDINDYLKQISQGASQKKADIAERLEELLKSEDFDAQYAEELLLALETCILDDDLENNVDYASYKRRVTAKEKEKRAEKIFHEVNQVVEDLWEQGYSAARNELSNKIVVGFFTDALQKAQDAVAQYPDNTRLTYIVDKAKRERDRMGQAENVMISGGQTEDFVALFQYIAAAPEDQKIPVYDPRLSASVDDINEAVEDNTIIPIGYFYKEEAREELLKQATPFVRDKLHEYMNDARTYLDNNRVRRAKIEFARTDKFKKLWELEPDVVGGNSKDEHAELRTQIEEEITQLEQAEIDARDADKRASQDPLAGWLSFERAFNSHPATQNSEEIKEVRRSIEQKVLDHLERSAQALQTKLLNGELKAVSQEATRHISDYGKIAGIEGTQALKILIELRDDSQAQLKKKEDIDTRLSNILTLVGTDPDEASKQFEALRKDYPLDLLREAQDFIEAQDIVEGALSLGERLSTFKQGLQSYNHEEVETLAKQARDWADNPDRYQADQNNYKGQFDTIAQQLHTYAEYLAVDRRTRGISVDYETVIREMEQVRAKYSHVLDEQESALQAEYENDLPNKPESLQERFTKRLKKLRGDYQQITTNIRIFMRIEERFNTDRDNLNIKDQLRDLDSIILNNNSQQESRWADLLDRTLQLITVQTNFDDKKLNDVLLKLEDFNSIMSINWKTRLKDVQVAQKARDDEKTGTEEKLKEAVNKWESIVNEFGGESRDYVISNINRLNRQLKEQQATKLLEANSRVDNNTGRLLWLNEVDGLSQDLKALATEALSTVDKLFYMTTAVKLDIVYAQYEPDVEKRKKLLDNVASYVNRNLVNVYLGFTRDRKDEEGKKQELNTKEWIAMALVASDIGNGMDRIYRNLKADKTASIAGFKRALDSWEKSLTTVPPNVLDITGIPEADILTQLRVEFNPAIQWVESYKQEQKQILNDRLQEVMETSENVDAEALPYIAKIFFLDKNDIAGEDMIEQLEKLGNTLSNRLVEVVDNFASATPYSGESGQMKFEAQSSAIDNNAQYIYLINDVLPQFPHNIEGLTNTDRDTLITIAKKYKEIYKEISRTLTLFEDEVTNFNNAIENISLTPSNWLAFSELVNTIVANFETNVDDLIKLLADKLDKVDATELVTSNMRTFVENHPYMEQLRAKADTVRILNTDIAQAVKEIIDAIEAEKFSDAQKLLERFPYDTESKWFTSRLHNEIQVDTPDGPKEGWEEITEAIGKGSSTQSKLDEWALPYYDPESPDYSPYVVNWDEIKSEEIQQYQEEAKRNKTTYRKYFYKDTGDLVANYFQSLVDANDYSEGVRYQVEYLLTQGDFDGARNLLKLIINDETNKELPTDMMSLQQASDYFGKPPLLSIEAEAVETREANDNGEADADFDAEDNNTETSTKTLTGSYKEAIEKADTQEAKDVLRWMQEHRHKPTVKALSEAKTALSDIEQQEAAWNELEREFSANLELTTEHLEKYENAWPLIKGKHLNNARDAYFDTKETLKKLELLCPRHDRLRQFETLLQGEKDMFED